MNKILSIIIPTYNGADCIEDTLNSVIPQILKHKDSVELIIRDNCSTDNTGLILKKYIDTYPDIIIYDRRSENIRSNENFRESIELSHGDYILLLGDDDLLFPNFVSNTIETILRYDNLGLIYYNRITTTRTYKGASLKHRNPNKNFYELYESAQNFISDHITGPDFMSVNVFKKDCYLKGKNFSKEKYYGYEWYSVLLNGINGYNCISFFQPMVLQRVPEIREWTDKAVLYIVFGLSNMFEDLNLIYPGINKVWSDYSKRQKNELLIPTMAMNPNIYRSKKDEIKRHFGLFDRCLANLVITYPKTSVLVKCILHFKVILFSMLHQKIKR